MKKITTLIVLMLLVASTYAQPRTINFTPFEGVQAYLFEGKAYSSWDHSTNLDNIKSKVTFAQLRNYPRVGKLGNQLKPTQQIHFTEIEVAEVADKGSYAGLNYILSKSWNVANGNSPGKMIFIKENAEQIKKQIESWYEGDTTATVYFTTRRNTQWKVGDEIPIHVWANGSFTINLPHEFEFISIDLFNSYGVKGARKTHTKIFDWGYSVNGNTVQVDITPTTLFHTTPVGIPLPESLVGNRNFGIDTPYIYKGEPLGAGMYCRGLRTLGAIYIRALAPYDGNLPGVQGGYIYVK